MEHPGELVSQLSNSSGRLELKESKRAPETQKSESAAASPKLPFSDVSITPQLELEALLARKGISAEKKKIEKTQPSDDEKELEELRRVADANDFSLLNPDEDKLIERASQEKFYSGLFRSSISLGISIVAMIMAHNNMSIEKITSVTVALVFIFYCVHIWYIFCKAERIFRIYTVAAVPDDWMNMSIAFVNKEYHTVPLQSISEFSAIAGGFARTALLRIGTVAWLSAFLVTVVRLKVGMKRLFKDGLLFELIGAFGIDIVGTFYLDPYSNLMKFGHYFGVFCCLGTVVGLWCQSVKADQNYFLTSVVTLVCVIFFGLFLGYYPYFYNPSKEELEKHDVVTSISRKILLFETLGLGMAALAFVLYFWFEHVPCELNQTCGTQLVP